MNRTAAALAADGGAPSFTIVPVERTDTGATKFYLDGLLPGDYHIYCMWDNCKPTRASVLLEDDYPRDGLVLRVEASSVVAVDNDLFPTDAIFEVRYHGPWPKSWERVELDGQRLLFEVRAPDGLPIELRVFHAGSMSRWCIARGVERGSERGLSNYLLPWPEVPTAARFDFANSTAGFYRCQSPRRGARIHLLSVDGTCRSEYSDLFGELTAHLAPSVALAVVEGDIASGLLIAALPSGAESTSIPRFPTFDESLSESAILVTHILLAPGETTSAATIETLAPQRAHGRLDVNGTGFVRLTNLRSVPTEVDVSIVPEDHRYAPFRARLSDLVSRSWRLECDVQVHAAFATVTPPVGVIRVAALPTKQVDRWIVFRRYEDVLAPVTVYSPKVRPRDKAPEIVFRWLSPGKYNVRAFGDGGWQADVDVRDGNASEIIDKWQRLTPGHW